MRISIIGTGYVGLVTGVCLAEIGHEVVCLDTDSLKIEMLKDGICPIYEPGLEDLIQKNIKKAKITFTDKLELALHGSDVIYVAVGTPEKKDGSANLDFLEQAAYDIARIIQRDTVIVIKSTVPVGTNDWVEEIIRSRAAPGIKVDVVSNPEFLKEGDAIRDSFCGDRIVIGAEDEQAAAVIEELNKPFGIPVFKTDRKSAEMVKYASNAFLATKISFINEISTICELLGADVEKVAAGMGMDHRIGPAFLKAGIGYGGSCFPKDTKALIQIAGNVSYDFQLLKGVVSVNQRQQKVLLEKLKRCMPSIKAKRIGVLGLAFKPGTDDMREAASIRITDELVAQGAEVVAFDPAAARTARASLDPQVMLVESAAEAIAGSDAVLIVTEWPEIKKLDPAVFHTMKQPLIIDGRNCFSPAEMQACGIAYYSIGRSAVTAAVQPLSM